MISIITIIGSFTFLSIFFYFIYQARFRMEPRMDTIEYNTCHFGFSKLKGTGGLSPEVQRQLRSLGLATGKVARR
jgi:hypothetical protein